MTNFSIIIPTLMQSEDRLRRLLDVLRFIVNGNEVIVVFQGSNYDTYHRICNNYEDINGFKFYKSEKVGISIARNIGIKNSKNEWIVLLDDDVIVLDDFFIKLEANILPSDLFYYGNIYLEGTTKPYVNFSIRGRQLDYFSYNRVCSVALVISRKAFNKIGLFDVRLGTGSYFGSCEESDLILRALKTGIQIKYLPDHNVWHPIPSFPHGKAFRYGAGLGGMYRKHIRSAPPELKFKLILDVIIRVCMLATFMPKRYFFLCGFAMGLYKFK